MDRLSFLKSLFAAPFLPLAAEEKEHDLNFGKITAIPSKAPEWPFDCELFDFQKKIWEDYHSYKYNLILGCRGSSKSFMAKKIAALKSCDLNYDKKNLFSTPREIIIDELNGLHCTNEEWCRYYSTINFIKDNPIESLNNYPISPNEKRKKIISEILEKSGRKVTIFTSIYDSNEDILKKIASDEEWNVIHLNINTLPEILFNQKALKAQKKRMSEKEFKRELLCEFS